MTSRRCTDEATPPQGLHPATPAWLSVVKAYHLCEAALARRLAPHGLDLGTHEILINLQQSPGLGQQDLARRCFTTKSNVSMLVSRLEKDGLLVRSIDPGDARARKLILTAKGTALADLCGRIQFEVIDVMTAGSSAADLERLSGAMARAAAALEKAG